MPKINQEEYEFLKWLGNKWKWIARDIGGDLYCYKSKPCKVGYLKNKMWGQNLPDFYCVNSTYKFSFIQWEDGEPYNIQELIEEYEDESEETEVKKDVEWLKEEFYKAVDRVEKAPMNGGGELKYIHIDYIKNLISQLDEPEDDLSQELPVIPQFVAEWIGEMKQDERPLYSVMSNLMNKTNHTWAVWKSAEKNFSEVVAQAWLAGYEVAEEQKYVVKFPMSKNNDNQYAIVDYSGNIWIDALPSKYKLTEEEIRGLTKGDVLFEHFAVKAEELEGNDKD